MTSSPLVEFAVMKASPAEGMVTRGGHGVYRRHGEGVGLDVSCHYDKPRQAVSIQVAKESVLQPSEYLTVSPKETRRSLNC